MLKFTNAILVKNWLLQKIPNSEDFIVMEEFMYYVDYNNKNYQIIIPKYMRSNFGSIPPILRGMINPVKFISYILHDYLFSPDAKIYILNSENYKESLFMYSPIYFNRKMSVTFVLPNRYSADNILRDAMKVEWACFIERNVVYVWLRLFWWVVWNLKHKEEDF